MQRHIAALAACLGVFAFASSSHGGTPNTTAAGAVSYEVNTGWTTDGVDDQNPSRYFIFTELAGRSYCVEAELGPASYFPFDPNLTLFTDTTGTTVYLSNDNGLGDPTQYKGARVCYQSALAVGTTTARLVKVNIVNAASGDSGFIRIRVVDGTLVFPGVCLANDSTGAVFRSAALTVTNTTTVDVNGSIYVPGYGAILTFVVKAPNQATSTNKNPNGIVRKTINAPSGVVNWAWGGAAYLTHDGPPGALEAWVDTPDPSDSHCLQNSGPATVRLYAYPR